MKRKMYQINFNSLLIIALMAILMNAGVKAQVDSIDYFGQIAPGDSAVVFARGIISLTDRKEGSIAFSPDGNEIYFNVFISNNTVEIYCTKRVNNTWTEQVLVPFSGNIDVGPFLSADGNKLYFTNFTDGDIYMVERAAGGWGEPQRLPPPINSSSSDAGYKETADGDVYIYSNCPGGSGNEDIWLIRHLADQAENLGPIVNSNSSDITPYIAADGSYLIFCSERYVGAGRAQLYISFNKGNDGWSAPINMNSSGAKINDNSANHTWPSLSPDGKFLFFDRYDGLSKMDIYWVSTSIIDVLRKYAFAPKLSTPIRNITINADSLFNYQIPENTFSCEYGTDSLKYSAILDNGSDLPSWLHFDAETGTFYGTPTQPETDTIKLTATNKDTASASCTFRITVTPQTGIEEDNFPFPKEFNLSQNYPNPFNPSTVIRYRLSQAEKIKLSIYNLLSQKIKTLVDSYQSIGEHSVVWDAKDERGNSASSGVYFYKLETADRMLQMKMVLVK